MKIYLSYWPNGYIGGMNEEVMNMHKLCVYLINKIYGECHLMTDKRGKEMLKNLPFTTISTDLEIISNVKTHNWALGKLYTYFILSKYGINFLHVDYDVFLWKPLPDFFIQQPILAQSVDYHTNFYCEEIFQKEAKNKYLANKINKNEIAYNMGVFGGKDLDFISKYSESAIELTLDKQNENCFTSMKNCFRSSVACFCEQMYLRIAEQHYNKKINCLFGNERDEKVMERLAVQYGYTHLIGGKSDPIAHKKIKKRIVEFGLE